MKALDHIDKQILVILQQNSSLTTKELAAAVNLSTTPVFERIKRLEQEGYIKKYMAVIDPGKVNKSLTVFCHIRLSKHSREIGQAFVDQIQQLSAVTECYNTSGDYDFLLKVVVEDMKAYQNFVLNNLGEIESIGSTHSTFVMGEVKNDFMIPID